MESEPESFRDEEGYEESGSFHIPPKMLFGSFFLVAGAYVATVLILISMAAGLAYGFFPETVEAIGSKPEVFKEKLMTNAEQIFPPEFYWPLLILNTFVCFVVGLLVAKLARFGKFAHAVFLAIILFISFLQSAIGSPPGIQVMYILFMGSAPIAVLVGASKGLGSKNVEPDRDPASDS